MQKNGAHAGSVPRLGYKIVSVKSNNEKAIIIIQADVKKDRNDMIRALLSIDGIKSVSEG